MEGLGAILPIVVPSSFAMSQSENAPRVAFSGGFPHVDLGSEIRFPSHFRQRYGNQCCPDSCPRHERPCSIHLMFRTPRPITAPSPSEISASVLHCATLPMMVTKYTNPPATLSANDFTILARFHSSGLRLTGQVVFFVGRFKFPLCGFIRTWPNLRLGSVCFVLYFR
jgi:hypothetical protein